MRKYIMLIIMLFIPLMVNAETCDVNRLTISSIKMENKTDNVVEIEQASTDGKSVALNLNMSEVGDNIKYKLLINNESSEKYIIDDSIISGKSDYFDYSIETEDNSNIIKANSSKMVYLNVEYKKDVPGSNFESGVYSDNDNVTINLTNNNGLFNPKTGVLPYSIIIIGILIISLTFYMFLKKQNYSKLMIIVLGMLIIIPIYIEAVCKYEINIESNITVNSGNRQCSHNSRDLREFVMCEIETDIYDVVKKEKDEIIKDTTKSEEEKEEARLLMKSYDYLIENFDWDSYIDKNLNRNNYRNYPEGIYINGYRLGPIFKQETANDIFDFGMNYGANYPEILPNWKENTINDVRGYSFTKPNKSSRIRNVFERNDLVFCEAASNYSCDLKIATSMDLDIYYNESGLSNNSVEIEYVDVYLDLYSELIKETDAETGYTRYYESKITYNPELFNNTILHREVGIINDWIDLYVNTIRSIPRNVSEPAEKWVLLYQLFSRGKSIGYLKYNFDDILNGSMDKKTQEILDAFDLNVTDLRYMHDYINSESLSMQSNVLKNYYDHHGFEYEMHPCEGESNTGILYPIPVYEDIHEKIKIVYNDKYYEGVNALDEFMIDYFNITGNSYENKLYLLHEYLFQNVEDTQVESGR